MNHKTLYSWTKVIQPRLTIRGFDEPILWTLAVAGKTIGALFAVIWQGVALVAAKLPLLGRIDNVNELAVFVEQIA
jgi:hypothetical protein